MSVPSFRPASISPSLRHSLPRNLGSKVELTTFQWSACSAGYLDGSHIHSTCSAAFMAYQLLVAITAMPFETLRIFCTPGIDCALRASNDLIGWPLLGLSWTAA